MNPWIVFALIVIILVLTVYVTRAVRRRPSRQPSELMQYADFGFEPASDVENQVGLYDPQGLQYGLYPNGISKIMQEVRDSTPDSTRRPTLGPRGDGRMPYPGRSNGLDSDFGVGYTQPPTYGGGHHKSDHGDHYSPPTDTGGHASGPSGGSE